jgi:hypothetical protein
MCRGGPLTCHLSARLDELLLRRAPKNCGTPRARVGPIDAPASALALEDGGFQPPQDVPSTRSRWAAAVASLAWLAPPTSPMRPKSSGPRNRSVELVDLAPLAAPSEPKSSRRSSRRDARSTAASGALPPWRSDRLTHTNRGEAELLLFDRRSRTDQRSGASGRSLRPPNPPPIRVAPTSGMQRVGHDLLVTATSSHRQRPG